MDGVYDASMRRPRTLALMLAAVMCGACTGVPPPADPTPMPTEPCEPGMVAPAIERLATAQGYRWRRTAEVETLAPGSTLERPVFEWSASRSEGSYRAPDLRAERVIADDEGALPRGYLTIGDRDWMLLPETDDGPAGWRVVEGGASVPGEEIGSYIGDADRPLEPEAFAPAAGAVPGLPGEGGCVLEASVDGDFTVEMSLRIDPANGELTAWRAEATVADDGSAVRQTIELDYGVPSVDEFQPPTDVVDDQTS